MDESPCTGGFGAAFGRRHRRGGILEGAGTAMCRDGDMLGGSRKGGPPPPPPPAAGDADSDTSGAGPPLPWEGGGRRGGGRVNHSCQRLVLRHPTRPWRRTTRGGPPRLPSALPASQSRAAAGRRGGGRGCVGEWQWGVAAFLLRGAERGGDEPLSVCRQCCWMKHWMRAHIAYTLHNVYTCMHHISVV